MRITESQAKTETVCRGCGGSKQKGDVVCRYCSHYRKDVTPYRFWGGELTDWIRLARNHVKVDRLIEKNGQQLFEFMGVGN